MDIISIELGIGMLLLFVVPIIYIATNQSRKEKKTIKKVEALSQSATIRISSSAIFHSLFIGIDETSKKLVTATVPVKEKHIHVFSLTDIKDCSVQKTEVPIPGRPKVTTIEKVAIDLTFKDKGKKNYQIYFFNEEIGMDAHTSVHQASTWSTIIKENLK